MTESKSSMSPLYNQLDLSCSNCGIPVVLRSQARYLAVHDPDTGDLICKQCRLEKWDSEATSDYDDDYDEDVYENDDDGEEDDNDGIFIDGDIIYYPHIDKTSSRSHINSGDQKGLTTITLGPLWSQQMFVKTCLRALRQVEAPCTPRRANFNTAHSAAPLFARREVRLASARHLDVKAPSSSSALPACDLCLESLSILNMALEHAHHSTVYCDNCRQCLCFHHLLSHNRTLGDLGHKVVPVQSRNQVDRKEEDELVSIDVCKNDLPSWQTEDCLSVACGPCNMPIYWRGNPNPRREKILGLLTLPFPIDPARAESIDIAEGEGRSNVLLSASHSLTIVHDRLTSFVHRLTDISSFAVRQIRALSSNNSCTIASIQWGKLSDDVERILKSLCGSYNKGLQSLKRTLHYIEGTLLEAIAMLGLEGVTDREEMQEILLLGKWPLANELLLMETLGCLRDTLEYGDVGGLSRLNVTSLDECLANIDVLTCIMTTMQTDCVALEAIGEIGHTTEEKLFGHIISLFQGVIALDSVYFDMFTSPLPRESLRSLLEWKIELGCQLHPEGLLEEIIKALVYDNMMPTGKRDQHTLNLIERFYTIDSPDIHLAKALLKYSGLVGSNYLLFSQAQEKGCNHPLLFYYLGDCYVAGIDIDKDLEKAAMCYQKAIEGGYEAGYEGLAKVHSAHAYDKGRAYLEGLVNEGYTHGNIYFRIGTYYKDRISYSADPEQHHKAMAYYEQTFLRGYITPYECLYRPYWNDLQAYKPPDDVEIILYSNAPRQLKEDTSLRDIVLSIKDNDTTTVQCWNILRAQQNSGIVALHFASLLIQHHNPLGYGLKSLIYSSGAPGIPRNCAKAKRIVEEGHKMGIFYKHECSAEFLPD